MKIVLLPQAEEDLLAIQDPLFTKIVEKLRLLESFPMLGPALEGRFAGYRALTIDIFRLVYSITSRNNIEVAYIRHCKRRLLKPK